MKLNTPTQLEHYLTSLFELDKLNRFPEEWGLNVRGDGSISKIGYCTNLIPQTVEEAIHHEVDLLLTHHDAWSFMYGMQEVCASKLEAHGISNAFFHLLLDDADFGTNATLGKRLELRNIVNSTLHENVFYCGRVGEWEYEKPLDDVKALLESILGESVRAWRNHDHPIKRACIVTGGGSGTDFIKEAVDHGCDVYITGEKSLYTVEYAKFVEIDLLIGSHTATELPGVESFARKVAEKLPDVRLVHLHEERIE